MSIDPTTWLLMRNYPDGKPWGTKTNMADRAKAGGPYWDEKCKVTRLVGSYRAMCAMRDELEQLILDANSSALPPGQRGHVYIADWRMSTVRDFSTKNPWQTGPWKPSQLAQYKDQTAIGLFLRLMQAGVVLRILLWYPTTVQSAVAGLTGHIEDHSYLACIIHEENERLKPILNSSLPLGIVGLDARTAEGAVAGAHHQKMMVIRAPGRNVAFCGGVDLTFTRRDAPSPVRVDTFDPTTVAFLDGDWQSATMPDVKPVYPGNLIWPPDGNTKYDAVLKVNPPSSRMPTDLPMHTDDKDVCEAIGGLWHDDTKTCEYTAYTPAKGTYPGTQQRLYGLANHVWHDQHLKLQGPIVSTLEWQFAERWIDAGRCNVLTFVDWARGWVLFSSAEAYDSVVDPTVVHPLPTPAPEPAAGGSSIVQMWRTIPLRRSRGTGQLFDGGEFTVMSGYTKAINAAKELIWIFDQYMWSEAATRQLNYRLRNSQNLCVLMVLPPFADSTYKDIHRARHFALAELMRDLTTDQATRVAVYDLWQPSNHVKANGRGVYVHAKTQTYDGALLVCGSANFNRRSLMCDTELACAVLDTAVVAQHQRDLWQLLFGNVTTQDGAWPGLDLNGTGSGAKFLKAFRAAAASEDAFVAPDPWDDANPDKTNPAPAVALPNGVPRPPAFPGPIFEVKYGEGIDPGGFSRSVEQDVIENPKQPLPRPPRLDDIVSRVEVKNAVGDFPLRKQGNIITGPLITWPAVNYPEPPKMYEFTENAEWWKQLCVGFPCFNHFPLWWPDYDTTAVEATIDGHPVVIQLWKGWCQKLATLRGMPGGVGAEVGVYRRIPLSQLPVPKSLPHQFGWVGQEIVKELATLNDNEFWWPFPELEPKISFSLTNPDPPNNVLFNCQEEDTWWACKWMNTDCYDKRFKNENPHPILSWNWKLSYTIKGKSSSFSGTWP